MILRLDNEPNQPAQPRPMELRMPYAPQQGVGLGDVIARITQSMGIESCTPCQRRQQQLNNWMRFTSAW